MGGDEWRWVVGVVGDLPESSPSWVAPGGGPWRAAFDHAPVGMALCSLAGVALQVNRALVELVGRDASALVGNDFFSITHETDVAAARAACRAMQVSGGRTSRLESRFVHADQHAVWVLVSTSAVLDEQGRPASLVMHVEDISHRKTLEAELVSRAEHDALTSLLNRGAFVDRLQRTLARAAREGRPTSVLFVDLDDFKDINDTHGHAVGDLVLVEVARRMERWLRPGDLVGRFGGDEFTVICPGAEQEAAGVVARRIAEVLSEPFSCDGRSLTVTATVGLATHLGGSNPDGAGLLAAADTDMYTNKARRRR